MSLPGPLFFNIITTIFVNKLANLTRPSQNIAKKNEKLSSQRLLVLYE